MVLMRWFRGAWPAHTWPRFTDSLAVHTQHSPPAESMRTRVRHTCRSAPYRPSPRLRSPPPITTSLCTTFLAHPSIEVPPAELLPQVRHRRRPVARCAHSPRPRRECQGDDALAKGSGRSNEDRGLPGHLAGQLARVQLFLTALLNGIRRFVRREDGVAVVRNLRALIYKFCAVESRRIC